MSRIIPKRRWTAIREVCEGMRRTHLRMGAATGIHPDTIAKKALVEGWKVAPHGVGVPAENAAAVAGADALSGLADAVVDDAALARLGSLQDPEERLAWLNAHMGSALRAIAASGRGLTKPQIDALTALTRLIEKSETLAKERAVEKQTRSDDELAELLSRLDARIAELAEARADWLVQQRNRTGDDAAGAAGGAVAPPF